MCVLSSPGSVVVLSSLEFDMNKLTDLMKTSYKLPRHQNIYAYIKYKIQYNNVTFLKGAEASAQLIHEIGTYNF